MYDTVNALCDVHMKCGVHSGMIGMVDYRGSTSELSFNYLKMTPIINPLLLVS